MKKSYNNQVLLRKSCISVLFILISIFTFSSILKAEGNHPSTSINAIAITGHIVDEQGNALKGVSVRIKDSRIGVVTNDQGNFTINAAKDQVLIFSYIGYQTQELTVGTATMQVVMQEDKALLSEVVVTALGVKKSNRSLGYSVSELKGDELAAGREANIANELSGKVAGLQVSRAASGAGGSSKLVIRGLSSLQGNSQPLYVVDGIPINNSNYNPASRSGGTDYGDGISNIDPNDVATISILKGANAAALYGQQGANGVVIITTKTGKNKTGLGVKFSSDFMLGTPLVLPDFQDVYGQGFNGQFTHFRNQADDKIYPYSTAIANNYQGIPKTSGGRDRNLRGSWGPKMEGQTYEDQWGAIGAFVPQPNTFQKFFDTEKQWTNSLNLDGGSDNVNYYFSYSNLMSKGYVPTNTLNRNNFSVRTVAKITPQLNVDLKINYISQKANNRPTLSDAADNPAYLFISQPRSMSLASLQNMGYTQFDIDRQLGYSAARTQLGVEKTYATNSSTANPYWTIKNQGNNDTRDRILAMGSINYDIMPWLKATLRGGTDFYTEQRFRYRAKNTYASPNLNGDMSETVIRVKDDYADALLNGNYKLNEDWNISLNAGASYQKKYARTTGNVGNEFVIPDLFAITNVKNTVPIYDLQESEIHSVYSFGEVNFKNYWFVDYSLRNDWSSTLPAKNNSFFYPSITSSLILSDLFNIKGAVDFLKIRASLAQAGSSGRPYQNQGTFSLTANTLGGQPLGSYTNTVTSDNLKNELTTSLETGFDVKFLNGFSSLSFTLYQSNTKNQILDVPIPNSTTYSVLRLNAGNIQNRGLEASLTLSPLHKNKNIQWDITFNYAANRNKVLSLYPGISVFTLGADRNVAVIAQEGKPFGELVGTSFAWVTDAQGNRLIDGSTGLPLRVNVGANNNDLGNVMPNWTGGLNNSIRYKGVTFGFLIDIRQGGKLFSQSVREELVYGTSKKTLAGRDGTYVAQGMVATKDSQGNWVSTGVQNTKQVFAQDYWNTVASDKDNVVSSELINDASYISMREMSLSYQIPVKFLSKLSIKRANIGVYGRNLFYFERHTDGFAPEASAFNVDNSSLGLESTSLPLMRNYGVKLNLEF